VDDLSQYQELYLQTGKEYVQSLNASLLLLEKNSADKAAIEEVFRSAHSLKSQSAAMGYQSTGYLCHVIEDVFYEVKNDRLKMSPELADHLFKALDGLSVSLARIEKENQEADLSGLAEALKRFAGVATAGAGKTEHNTDQTATSSPPAAIVESPAKPPVAAPVTALSPNEAPKAAIATIAVKVEVLDQMMNLLESLLVEQLKLKRLSDQADLKDYINASEKILASLQYQIMKARAVPVSVVFDHFPRAVRDLARAENKQIELVITGGDLELDRTIVDRLDEPLIHLLRNAVSHGIKDKGTITLAASRQKDYAQISVADNGRGIDWPKVAEKAGLPPGETDPHALKEALFSGISTSSAVTQISGRGVGLTVIKKMVDNFGGSIDVMSQPGQGTTLIIKLPLTLAIAKALIVTVNHKYFAIPTLVIDRLVTLPAASVKKIADQEAFVLGETEIPLVRLGARLAPLAAKPLAITNDTKDLIVVVVGDSGEKVGLVVDDVRDTTDIVIKPVPESLKSVPGFSGVTILGNGQTALILNPQELI
jgi:two-component system chemotaxis sensor kinase CheA